MIKKATILKLKKRVNLESPVGKVSSACLPTIGN